MKINHHYATQRSLRPVSAIEKGNAVNTQTAVTRQRWMIVDDDKDLLLLMKQMLELVTDAEIVCYHNSVEALLVLQASADSFDRVITDYHMPGMDGMELCRRLRRFAPGLSVILATSDTDISHADALGNGFDNLLRKPFTFEALTELLVAVENDVALNRMTSVTPQTSWTSNARQAVQTFAAQVTAPCSMWIASF